MTGGALQRNGRATILDVAQAAGVSRQTVSNTLNNPERVAPSTLERVTREIDRLGFTPHAGAQQLRRRRTGAYGFDVDPSGIGGMGPVLSEFLVCLTALAPSQRQHLVTFAGHGDSVLTAYEQLWSTGLVDGFFLGDTTVGDPRPGWLLENEIPFVAFGRIWDQPELPHWVDVDGRVGMELGVGHLLEQGYASVAYLGWPTGSPVGDDRRRGWLAGLAAAGLADERVAEEVVQDLRQATAVAGRLLDQLDLDAAPAVLCASDTLALGTFRAARARGLEPGRDVGIMGFDDSDIAVAVELTSLRQPLAEAATHAWRLLETGDQQGAQPVLVAPTLVTRASTQPRRTQEAPAAG